MLLGLLAEKYCFRRSQDKIFWASVLVEAGTAQDTGSSMPPTLKMQHNKWEGSQFTSAFLHNFTLVEIKEVCLTEQTFLHLVKFYTSHLELLCKGENCTVAYM